MRFALWLLAIFAAAVGLALFATRSNGTVTLFWPPYRVDLSLNLTLIVLFASFVLFYLALRAFGALADLPRQAKAWRRGQRQDAMHSQLRDAMAQLLAGRFARAKKLAEQAHQHALLLRDAAAHKHGLEVQAMAMLIAAEAAHAMQESSERDQFAQAALALPLPKNAQHFKDGVMLRSARWMLDESDPARSLERLSSLSQGAQRRTLALRLKLRASQQARHIQQALETARLLAKHGGFSASAAQSLVRSLCVSRLNQAHDEGEMLRVWALLQDAERLAPEVAIHAATRLINLAAHAPGADQWYERARAWLEPVWQSYPQLSELAQGRVVRALEASFAAADASLDQAWLTQIEAAHLQLPHDARLQYLAGMACLRRQLWGKAQQLLWASVSGLKDEALRRSAWRSLARLAQQRGDDAAALAAWREAAQDDADSVHS